MKQHMLTHKIRDMPQHMFENSTRSPSLDRDSGNSFSSNCQLGKDSQIEDDDAKNYLNRASDDRQRMAWKGYDTETSRRESISPREPRSPYISDSKDEEPPTKKPIRKLFFTRII